MRKLGASDESDCGLEVALMVMGGKWKALILYHLRTGPRRFSDLRRLVTGISEKVLIQQLRELAAAEVLVRRDYQQVPPKVDYTMTPGRDIATAVRMGRGASRTHRGHAFSRDDTRLPPVGLGRQFAFRMVVPPHSNLFGSQNSHRQGGEGLLWADSG